MVEKGLKFFHIPYNAEKMDGLCLYIRELKKWNQHINLTGLKALHRIVGELLYDAFFLYGYIEKRNTVLDIGSGAGVLSIPMAILSENTKIYSVDKSLKKIQFQSHIKRLLRIKNIEPIHSRAEVLDPMEIDALIAKGFGSVQEILEKGGRHIRSGGSAFVLKGKSEEPTDFKGFELDNVVPYILPADNRAYRLFIYRKL